MRGLGGLLLSTIGGFPLQGRMEIVGVGGLRVAVGFLIAHHVRAAIWWGGFGKKKTPERGQD